MNYKFLLILIIFPCLLSCSSLETVKTKPSSNCITLQECLYEIKNIEYKKYGISKEASSLAEKLAEFGEPGLISLLALLDSNDPTTLKVAGYAIGKFPNIDEKYIPQIVSGVENGIPWLVNALGNIDSDEAAKVSLSFYLSASSSPHNQEANAVERQGLRVLPFIIDSAKCGLNCDKKTLGLLSYIVGEMDEAVKKVAAESIIKQLNQPEISLDNKKNLLGLYFNMGDSGRFVEESLYQLKQQQPQLESIIDYAFIGIKSKHSGQVFARYLKVSPSILVLRDVSEMGAAGKDAGPILIELLSHPDNEIRIGAVRALGFIEYLEGESHLKPLMMVDGDVRLNWSAAVALGMIGQESSIDSLKHTAENHWYPAVQNAAKKSILQIEKNEKHKSQYHRNNFAFDFFSYQHLNVKSCEEVSLKKVPEDSAIKLNGRSHESELKKLTYDSYILSYGAADEEEQREKDPDGIIEVNQGNVVEHREDIKQTPDVALKIEGGWLAGSDRGEWGGELVFIPDEGKSIKLLDDNVEDVYKLGDRYIAVAGLAHMMSNNGVVYTIERKGEHWYVEPWKSLPGAPRTSWFVETGELLINTYSGGSVLLSADGSFRMAPCNKYEESRH